MKEGFVKISLEEYRELLDAQSRIDVFAEYVNNAKDNIRRENCSTILGFYLEEKSIRSVGNTADM